MEIQVNRRTREDGALVFEIIASNPHQVAFTGDDREMMDTLQEAKVILDRLEEVQESNRINVDQGLYRTQKNIFDRVLESIRFSIENSLQPKFNPICQEIYNWIYEHQKGPLKSWMSEFDPQRSKYYFDNDRNIENELDDDDDCDDNYIDDDSNDGNYNCQGD